jgi:glycosyltransferase involved in cell wall biosynthesis
MPAKILVVSTYPPPAEGVANHTRVIATEWARTSEVLIAAPGNIQTPCTDPDGLKIARILGPTRRSLSQAHELVRAFRPDMVFVQFIIATLTTAIPATIALCREAKRQGASVVVAYHEPAREFALLGPVAKRIYRSIAATADVAVVFSVTAATTLREARLPGELVVLHHGIPDLVQPSAADLERLRVAYRLPPGNLILSLGFIHPYKGTDLLLSVVADIAPRGACRPAVLIAGSPRKRPGIFKVMELRDHAYHHRLLAMAKSLPSDVRISFTSFVPEADLPALLKLARVMVLPYRKDTQSGIASLAIAAELPIVCSDQPALREEIGGSAVYFPPGDRGALRRALTSAIEDDDLHRSLAAESRRIHCSSSMVKIAQRLLEAPDLCRKHQP